MSAVIDNLTRGNDSMEEEFSELNAELNGIIAETTQVNSPALCLLVDFTD